MCTQPVAASHESTVHGFPSSHVFGVLTHPFTGSQVSVVQALLSEQLTGVWTQPVAGLQLSTVQALLSSQLRDVPPPQTPAVHVSPTTHMLPELHEVPSCLFAYSHCPVAWLQIPSCLQGLVGASHTTSVPPVHTPAWQVSVWVQALLSEQDVPSAFAGLEQTPVAGSQVPAVWH